MMNCFTKLLQHLNIGIVALITLFFLNTCNKHEKDYVYTAGKEKRMIITDYQKSIEAIYVGIPIQKDSIELDLDQDGKIDIIGMSLIDTLVDPESNHYKELSLLVVNNDFIFSEIKNSGIRSAIFNKVTFKYDGTFPKKTKVFNVVCGEQPNSNLFYKSNSPKFLLINDELNENEFNWETTYDPKINLKVSAYTPESLYQPTWGNDSLVGNRYDFDEQCEGVPENENVYLPFLKQEGAKKRYGWLEIKVTGNKILFIQSVIQQP